MTWINIATLMVVGCLTALCAYTRGRSPVRWFFLGAFLGLIALIILFLMPSYGGVSSVQPNTVDEKKVESIVPQPVLPSAGWFFLDEKKAICGPYPLQTLQEEWQKGILKPASWIWNEGIGSWRRISEEQAVMDWLQEHPTQPLS